MAIVFSAELDWESELYIIWSFLTILGDHFQNKSLSTQISKNELHRHRHIISSVHRIAVMMKMLGFLFLPALLWLAPLAGLFCFSADSVTPELNFIADVIPWSSHIGKTWPKRSWPYCWSPSVVD